MVPSLAERLPLDRLRALAAEYPIRELAVFGSVVRPEFSERSDVDFLVEFEPDAPVGFLVLAELQERLREAVGRPVDLVPKSGLKPLLRAEVLRSARRVYAR